ncbi:sialate O-acetylesterase [Mucilaginibacter arboris]|uniref:Sialate O-acetylesterase n=1 Tax=Mucilaginibacter arboris TaxID=2682090 RepID=A0A7K1SYY2_9SPHI|nr:sialate O-acetylesterase [Mucilaginibacter arboris]MVN22534.1 sialate O-acetylesterase [Mucilaginibacter arboris]
MKLNKYFSTTIACLLVLVIFKSSAQVRLPQLVSDGMVLQRNAKANIWGWAATGEKVRVNFNGKSYRTTTPANGKWKIALNAMKAGGPYTMDITASNHIVLKDILIGDVWFCWGQSNMVLPMERVKEKYPDEIANANYPQIRNFFVPTASDVIKVHDNLQPGKWMAATPQNVMNFGAVSYFFAKKIFTKYHVPIGLINSSVGGTPIQAWISEDGIKPIPTYAARLAQIRDTAFINQNLRNFAKNEANRKPFKQLDKGLTGPKTWYDESYVPQGWHPFWLPGYWADQGISGLNGVVWFRKEIDLPANLAGKPAQLMMGRMVDADQTYVNGKQVGNITYQYPPRRYVVPAGLLKPGKNLIVVRLTNTLGKGGFVPDKPYHMLVDGQKIDLRGDWQYKVGQVFSPVQSIGNGISFSAQNEPAGLYNTMVAPAIDYTIEGILWYQGEANTDKPKEYEQLLPALIADWRNKWQEGNLPFIYAQLPNFMEVQYSPSESKWAELREAQLKTLAVPNTAMAVAIDAGEWNDIHPLNKKDVGERLALAAEKLAYGNTKVVSSGPIYQTAKIEGNKIVVNFSNTGSGLVAKDGAELEQFAIAGADKKFVWANATIKGNQVIVSSDEVPDPVYVRYAWADNPEGANLYNKEGLPAPPFETGDLNK